MPRKMTIKTRSLLQLMLGSVFAFVAGLVWGAVFAFPYPDASAEEFQLIRVHEKISVLLILYGLSGCLVSVTTLLWRWLSKRTKGQG